MGLLSWLRPKAQEPLVLDQVVLVCVPHGVDDYAQFRDDASYFDYVNLNVYQLISAIGHQSDKVYQDGRDLVYRSVDSDEDLRVGVFPNYVVLFGDGRIGCPQYYVAWNHSHRSPDIARIIVANSYLVSDDTGRLQSRGFNGKDVVSGNELLCRLRPGSLDVRCSKSLKNNKLKIKI